MLPGVYNLLKNLKILGVSMAVVSNDISSRTLLAMKSLKIDHFFTEIIVVRTIIIIINHIFYFFNLIL